MHDIDRTWSELANDTEYEEGEFEFSPGEDVGQEAYSPFNEMQEMELASELLSVANEEELNYFLGSLIKKAGSAVGSFVSSPAGKALGGILKQAAKKALPVVGSALGGYIGGPAGANIGGKLASAAGNAFGLEFEGLDQEEEFEKARKFVRFAGATVGKTVQAKPGTPPVVAAKRAATAAAGKYLSGSCGAGTSRPGTGRSGRWYRRGRKVIIVGL